MQSALVETDTEFRIVTSRAVYRFWYAVPISAPRNPPARGYWVGLCHPFEGLLVDASTGDVVPPEA